MHFFLFFLRLHFRLKKRWPLLYLTQSFQNERVLFNISRVVRVPIKALRSIHLLDSEQFFADFDRPFLKDLILFFLQLVVALKVNAFFGQWNLLFSWCIRHNRFLTRFKIFVPLMSKTSPTLSSTWYTNVKFS